jgi:hypothetical protein
VNTDSALIDRIVAGVLQQLRPASPAAAPMAVPLVASVLPASTTDIELTLPVITAAVLEERVQPHQSVRLAAKSVLTPTARDWLKARRIKWSRAAQAITSVAAAGRQLLVCTVTPSMSSLRHHVSRELKGWKYELLGPTTEAVEKAAAAIHTADAELVLIVAQAAEVVACRLNRHKRVRCVALTSADHLSSLGATLSPNVLAFNPVGRSFVEIRNVLRKVAALPTPVPPQDWE